MEGGAANIVTIVLPYTDRLYRASPTPQQRNKKWPYEAGQKISFPYATSDMEMAYDAVAIHESLLKEDGFYNSTNYDNPAGAGMGIGFGSSPFAGGMHPPWFEDRSDQFEETQEQWIKRWMVGSMNKPIDGIRNGGRFQVNEEAEIMNEGIKDFMKRRSVISILEKPLRDKILIEDEFLSDAIANTFKIYGFKPFNRLNNKEFFAKIIFDFLERYPDGLADLTSAGFKRVYPKDENDIIRRIFNTLYNIYPDLQILIDDIKFGRLEFWFERITDRTLSGASKTKYEHSYALLKSNEEQRQVEEEKTQKQAEEEKTQKQAEEEKRSEQKKTYDPVLDSSLSAWLTKHSDLEKGEIDTISSKFSTCFEFVKLTANAIYEKPHLISKLYIDADAQQLEKNTEIMDEIYNSKYGSYIYAKTLNSLLAKSKYVYNLFQSMRDETNEWKEFQDSYLNEGIGDFIGGVAHKVGDKAKGAVNVVLTKHSVNKKFKLPLRKVNFDSQDKQEAIEKQAAIVFAKYSFVPYPMSTVGQFFGRIIADLSMDINKLAYPDKPETFKKIYPADENQVIFNIFQNIIDNNPDLKKIIVDIGHGNLEKWWRTIFGVRAEHEPGEPAIDVPDDKAMVRSGGEKIIDDERMAWYNSVFSGSDLASRKMQLKLLSDPRREKELAAYLTVQKAKVEDEEERYDISSAQDSEPLGQWARPKHSHFKLEQGAMNAAFQNAKNSPKLVEFIWVGVRNGCDNNGWQDIKQRVVDYWQPYKSSATNENFQFIFNEFINERVFINEAETTIATYGGFDINQASIREYIQNLDKVEAENNIMIMCKMQKQQIINATNFRDLVDIIIKVMSSSSPRQAQQQTQVQQPAQTQQQATATAQQSAEQSQEFMNKVSGTAPKPQPKKDAPKPQQK